MGAVESTKVALETMISNNIKPIVLVTLPLSKAYRHSDFVDLRPLADNYNIPVWEAENINDLNIIKKLRKLDIHYLLVIGWSQILKKEILELSKEGAIGYHPALLPENRGRAVIPWTIIQKKEVTGSTLFFLDEGVDSGDIIIQEAFPVALKDTATTLYQKHLDYLRIILSKVLEMMKEGELPRKPQNHKMASYCAKRRPSDGLIDWNLPAEVIWTYIRALTDPYPGAFTFYKERKLIIWKADYIEEGNFWGLPGQIQSTTEDGTLVKCGDDKFVLIKEVQFKGEERTLALKVIKLHEKLGIDWLTVYKEYKRLLGEKKF